MIFFFFWMIFLYLPQYYFNKSHTFGLDIEFYEITSVPKLYNDRNVGEIIQMKLHKHDEKNFLKFDNIPENQKYSLKKFN